MSCDICHMSCDMCHMSCDMCHMSCDMSWVICFDKLVKLVLRFEKIAYKYPTKYFTKPSLFQKYDLTTNIMTLVNLEPILGFMMEIKSILNYLIGYILSAIHNNMGHI